jgi:hypothetical protein
LSVSLPLPPVSVSALAVPRSILLKLSTAMSKTSLAANPPLSVAVTRTLIVPAAVGIPCNVRVSRIES